MVESEHNATSLEASLGPCAEQWAACVQQANEATERMCGGLAGSSDPQAWRRQWFESLSGNTDRYLRSPAFLQSMKAHIETLIRAKTSAPSNGAPAEQAARGLEDLTARVAALEQSLQVRLQDLEQRLALLEARTGQTPESDGWDRFLKALRVPRSKPRSEMGVSPHDVVYQEGTLRVLRYRGGAARYTEPILICFALVNRPYVMDLQEDRSVIRRLLERGFDVYLIDWGIPEPRDHALRLQDYVCRFLRSVVDFVCEDAGAAQLNLLGYCMGGTMSAMFTALHVERVRNLILMAAPIDFGGEAGLLNLWARPEYFDVDKLVDAYGNCPGEFLRYCFQLMKPVQNFAEKYLTFCDKLDDQAFLDNFFALERWASDSVPVAGETFREYVKALYQQNQLVKGQLSLGGTPVQLSAITCPLLQLVAQHDHLVPPSATLALERHVRSREVKTLAVDAGHIGLAVSSKAHRQLWPPAGEWIAAHSTVRS